MDAKKFIEIIELYYNEYPNSKIYLGTIEDWDIVKYPNEWDIYYNGDNIIIPTN